MDDGRWTMSEFGSLTLAGGEEMAAEREEKMESAEDWRSEAKEEPRDCRAAISDGVSAGSLALASELRITSYELRIEC